MEMSRRKDEPTCDVRVAMSSWRAMLLDAQRQRVMPGPTYPTTCTMGRGGVHMDRARRMRSILKGKYLESVAALRDELRRVLSDRLLDAGCRHKRTSTSAVRYEPDQAQSCTPQSSRGPPRHSASISQSESKAILCRVKCTPWLARTRGPIVPPPSGSWMNSVSASR